MPCGFQAQAGVGARDQDRLRGEGRNGVGEMRKLGLDEGGEEGGYFSPAGSLAGCSASGDGCTRTAWLVFCGGWIDSVSGAVDHGYSKSE